jgi:hypothetical protein
MTATIWQRLNQRYGRSAPASYACSRWEPLPGQAQTRFAGLTARGELTRGTCARSPGTCPAGRSLIAVAAAAVAVFLDRAGAARRHQAAPTA